MPIDVQLGEGTSLVLPTAVACSGLVIPPKGLPIQIDLHLADGSQVRLPVELGVLQKLHGLLTGLFQDQNPAP